MTIDWYDKVNVESKDRYKGIVMRGLIVCTDAITHLIILSPTLFISFYFVFISRLQGHRLWNWTRLEILSETLYHGLASVHLGYSSD